MRRKNFQGDLLLNVKIESCLAVILKVDNTKHSESLWGDVEMYV